jgi:ketosteroid isomerase-like protein
MHHKDIFRLFNAIDTADTETFVSFLSDDAVFRFGNMPAVEGKDNIRQFLNNWFPTIAGVAHDQIEIWEADGVRIMNGRVTYTRHDGSQLSVYFANTFKMKGDKVKDYLIFVDTSQLYAKGADEPADALEPIQN